MLLGFFRINFTYLNDFNFSLIISKSTLGKKALLRDFRFRRYAFNKLKKYFLSRYRISYSFLFDLSSSFGSFKFTFFNVVSNRLNRTRDNYLLTLLTPLTFRYNRRIFKFLYSSNANFFKYYIKLLAPVYKFF